MRRHCLLFVTLYCAAFTWLMVPFVMADDTMLRDAYIPPLEKTLTSKEALAPRLTVTAQVEPQDLANHKIR